MWPTGRWNVVRPSGPNGSEPTSGPVLRDEVFLRGLGHLVLGLAGLLGHVGHPLGLGGRTGRGRHVLVVVLRPLSARVLALRPLRCGGAAVAALLALHGV